MHWSVEEQTIPTAPLHITSINLRVDPSSSHIMLMNLSVDEPDADPPVAGYVLRFNRNGTFIAAEKIAPAAPPDLPEPDGLPPEAYSASHYASSARR